MEPRSTASVAEEPGRQRRWLLHGMTVATVLDLRAAVSSGSVDVTIDVGPPLGDEQAGERAGEVVLDRRGGSWRLRLPGFAEARVDLRATRAVLCLRPEFARLADVVAAGPVLGLVLALRGASVLHASAVAGAAGAVAIVGPSGAGKTTLAALACGQGAALVTDDTLVLREVAEGFACLRGTRQLRLRPSAEVLAARIEGRVEPTADDRVGVEPAAEVAPEVPLAAIVVPVRTGAEAMRRLRPAEAAPALLASSRTPYLREAEAQRRFFHLATSLAQRVAVYELVVGPPGSPPDAPPEALRRLLAGEQP